MVRAPVAAVGEPLSTSTLLTERPARIEKAVEVTFGRSLVVRALTRLSVPTGPLITPRSVSRTWSPAAADALKLSGHVIWSPAGWRQPPSPSGPRGISLANVLYVVPGGIVRTMLLPASPLSPPVLES